MAFLKIQSKTKQKLTPDLTASPDVKPGEIALSQAAISKIKTLAETQAAGVIFRIGLQGGGCSGVKPYFAFEASPKETDQVFSQDGLKICIDPKSLSVLGGSWLEYEDGFKIKSQNLKKSCSCGESFSL